MNYPLVTFVSPCYNHSAYVIESLNSIRNQTYPNIQHIIIDDGSKDDSALKINTWIEQNEYECEFIQHRVNKGISYTLNESIDLAKGEYWTPLATDDFVAPNRTELFVEFLEHHKTYGMCASDAQYVDSNSQLTTVNGTGSFLKNCTSHRPSFDLADFGTFQSLLANNYMPGSLMVRKTVFDAVGPYNTGLKVEDWDMWLRISKQFNIGFLNQFLTFYRVHTTNSILNPSMNLDLIKTQLDQYEYCKEHGYLKEYNKIYFSHFHNYFKPLEDPKMSMYFLKAAPWLTVKTSIHSLITSLRRRANS